MDNNIRIKDTTIEDLDNIVSLWNNGDVMFYVGFPNGLGVTVESLKEKWLPNINKNSKRRHYSIYHKDIGYCGESFYNVNSKNGYTTLDIKLLPIARGKGIAYIGLKYAIEKAFNEGKAKVVYVDPHNDNVKAFKLYEKLRFIKKPTPEFINTTGTYFELTYDDFKKSDSI